MPSRLAVCLALAALALGCGSSASHGGADAGRDGGTDAGTTGPSPGVCTPLPGQTGNALHVGAYCTYDGGQCGQYNLACSITLDSSGGNFCISLGCEKDADCGQDACCTGDPCDPVYACVPNQCFAGSVCPGIPACDAG